MYFIGKEKELKGKEIVFTHFARFADEMIIVTNDKGIFVFNKDDEEIDVYNELQARQVIFNNDYVRKELNELGIITADEMEQYQIEREKARKKQNELWEKQQAEKEYQNYLRLKVKYENK